MTTADPKAIPGEKQPACAPAVEVVEDLERRLIGKLMLAPDAIPGVLEVLEVADLSPPRRAVLEVLARQAHATGQFGGPEQCSRDAGPGTRAGAREQQSGRQTREQEERDAGGFLESHEGVSYVRENHGSGGVEES